MLRAVDHGVSRNLMVEARQQTQVRVAGIKPVGLHLNKFYLKFSVTPHCTNTSKVRTQQSRFSQNSIVVVSFKDAEPILFVKIPSASLTPRRFRIHQQYSAGFIDSSSDSLSAEISSTISLVPNQSKQNEWQEF